MTTPIIGLIGGTGLGQALAHELRGEAHMLDTPFGRPSAPIVRGRWEGAEIAFLARHGEGHTLCPTAIPYRANIYALKSIGVTHILASGATGSLREEMRPKDLVIIDQIIDRTYRRAGSFFDVPGLAAHVEFADPFCPGLRNLLLDAAASIDMHVHNGGTYVCMEGPAFSTVAESRLHRAWGGDLIGMTCMPEAKLAREAEVCYALVALPTDYDCWRPHDAKLDRRALLREIVHHLEEATANSIRLLRAAVRILGGSTPSGCTCGDALELAIWTRRERVSRQTLDRLGVIVSRYFPKA
jgi:5'-methylthioadenosine phosphorylase